MPSGASTGEQPLNFCRDSSIHFGINIRWYWRFTPTFSLPSPVSLLSLSTGQHEAVELRDGDKSAYVGKGVSAGSALSSFFCLVSFS